MSSLKEILVKKIKNCIITILESGLKKNQIPHHFFEIFDEKWKGGDHPNEVEKHWGVYYSNRKPKQAMK